MFWITPNFPLSLERSIYARTLDLPHAHTQYQRVKKYMCPCEETCIKTGWSKTGGCSRESDEKRKHIWMSAAHKGEWVLFSRFVKCQMRFLNKTRAFFALRMPPNLKWIPIHLSSELCSWASNVYANALHSHCELWSMRHLHTHIHYHRHILAECSHRSKWIVSK